MAEWAADGRFDDGGFIIWKGEVAEIILAFALSEAAFVFNGNAIHMAEG